MEKQACRGLVDRVGPLTYNQAETIISPGLKKPKKKLKKQGRLPASSESSSSTEKPSRKTPKMTSTNNGHVAETVASFNNASAATSGNVDIDDQSTSGHVAQPGN